MRLHRYSGVSYFKGPREQWKTGLRTYASVVYRDVWPGIDVTTTGTASRMEYTFVVKPGADPRRIRLRYRGASSVKLDANGALDVTTPAGGFRDEAPVAYQEIDGRRVEVASAYSTRSNGADFVYAFKLGRYDRTRPLVIDPVVLVYCGYIGGDGEDGGYGIAVDAGGNAYVTGTTMSSEGTIPVTVGPDLTYNGSLYDAFVAKVAVTSCVLGNLVPPGTLLGVKTADTLGAQFEWGRDPNASEYHLNTASQPPAMGVTGCSAPAPAPSNACTDLGAVSRDAPAVFYYQVRASCDAASEGP
jgi:hypothetical protein